MRHLYAQLYINVDMAQKLLEHEVEKGSAFVPNFLAYKVLILFSSPSATCIVCESLTSSRESVEEKHNLYL
ncbi:hypothetical protein Bca4012_018833 [Brassica carinata]